MTARSVFLDNMLFAYDAEIGRFTSATALSEETLTLEEVRRRGMLMSVYEVVTVAGIPYVHVEARDMLYRLGNAKAQLSADAFYEHERRGTEIAYPHGEAFRVAVAKELGRQGRARDDDRGR
jgi:hypothetical protein